VARGRGLRRADVRPGLTDLHENGIILHPSWAGGEAQAMRSSKTARVHGVAPRRAMWLARRSAGADARNVGAAARTEPRLASKLRETTGDIG
jgi:hypothetical protein